MYVTDLFNHLVLSIIIIHSGQFKLDIVILLYLQLRLTFVVGRRLWDIDEVYIENIFHFHILQFVRPLALKINIVLNIVKNLIKLIWVLLQMRDCSDGPNLGFLSFFLEAHQLFGTLREIDRRF